MEDKPIKSDATHSREYWGARMAGISLGGVVANLLMLIYPPMDWEISLIVILVGACIGDLTLPIMLQGVQRITKAIKARRERN